MPTACFWLEPTDRVRRALRRYASSTDPQRKCPGPASYHNGWHWLDGDVAAVFREEGGRRFLESAEAHGDWPPRDDPRWPVVCDGCGALFESWDEFQQWHELLYRRADTGGITTLRDAPAGAMWNAWWLPEHWRGPDGVALMVRTPGGDWHVDGEASNCTDKDGFRAGSHRCWTRVGDPRNPPSLSVGKLGGLPTCAAGAGSIQAGSYHGFLTSGVLT